MLIIEKSLGSNNLGDDGIRGISFSQMFKLYQSGSQIY